MLEALEARGVDVTDGGPADAAVVGWSRSFDFDDAWPPPPRGPGLGTADRHQRGPDPPDARRAWCPASGALLAAVATASGVTPEIAGKPHRADGRVDAGAVRVRRRGPVGGAWSATSRGTDGRLAERLGIPFALVDSGVTPAGTAGSTCRWPCGAPDFVDPGRGAGVSA